MKKLWKHVKNFIIDWWFLHLLELIWLAPAIYILISKSELVVVKILLAFILFISGSLEGFCVCMEFETDYCSGR